MAKNRRLPQGAVPVAALAGGLAATLVLYPALTPRVTAQDTSALTAEQLAAATSLEGAFMRVASTVGPATVSILARPATPPRAAPSSRTPADRSEKDGGPGEGEGGGGDDFDGLFGPRSRGGGAARGSGVIVRADGYILTNDHIVEEARGGEVIVTLADGAQYRGRAVRDARSDLALVKINPEKPLPFVRLADSSKTQVGQWAIAIGSPFGQQNTMTTGIVSALHRKKTIRDGGLPRLYPNLIQTDASINPGNSGGPLMNINGEVIGINVAIFSPTGTSLGIGYAIPSNAAKRVVDQLIAQGKVTRGSLGVVPSDIPPVLRKRLGTDAGAYIAEVAADTPADRAGMQPDDVVTRFNGQLVADERALREAIAAATPGAKVSVEVLRKGEAVTLAATLDALRDLPDAFRPSPASGKAALSGAAGRRTARDLGFEARPLSAEVREASGLAPTIRGLLVRRVDEGSAASDAELRPGTIITTANGVPVLTPAALEAALQSVGPGDALTLICLVLERDDKPRKIAVNIVVP